MPSMRVRGVATHPLPCYGFRILQSILTRRGIDATVKIQGIEKRENGNINRLSLDYIVIVGCEWHFLGYDTYNLESKDDLSHFSILLILRRGHETCYTRWFVEDLITHNRDTCLILFTNQSGGIKLFFHG